MFSRAYIQQNNGTYGVEESLVIAELDKRNIPYEGIGKKQILRRSLSLDKESLIVGDVDVMYGAMKQLGIVIPNAESYPSSLESLMFRIAKIGRIIDLESLLRDGNSIFSKPASTQKKFTGRVFETEQDLYYLGGVSRKLDVWLAGLVNFVSEFRVYVVESSIRAIEHYEGDVSTAPSIDVIQKAIDSLDSSGQSYAGYAIDFGVLDSGETALVEMNDGFAIGAYNDISSSDYTDMIFARWAQLLSTI
ncbi:ATP-grasp domain-containing protein [Teredinibacter purpureus]|uniref:ATP-grasp domain-containing protein n=1 Tax=Teredinibacter purpureus TaxID=2731756 RepID=UPI0005F83FEB|nr:ATP-grasp domain-containing protein [Teredinibacter purpureus]